MGSLSLKTCFISLATIFRKLNLLNKFIISCRNCNGNGRNKKGKKPNKFPASNFSILTTDQSFPTMELSNQLKQVFQFIDKNGDGKISPSELTQVLLSLGQEKSSATVEAQFMVREMDSDGDGFVDLDEFMTVMGVEMGLRIGHSSNSSSNSDDHKGIPIFTWKEKEEHLMEAFLVFDRDKNGFISAKELQRVLINLGCRKCTLKHCRRMIKGVDKDGDGFVNFQEFKSMMN